MEVILRHHDTLRLRFERRGHRWIQTHAGPSQEAAFEYADFSRLTRGSRSEALRERTLAAQASLDIGHGPLIRVVYLTTAHRSPGACSR